MSETGATAVLASRTQMVGKHTPWVKLGQRPSQWAVYKRDKTACPASSPATGADKEGNPHKSISRLLLIKEIQLYSGIQVHVVWQDYKGEVWSFSHLTGMQHGKQRRSSKSWATSSNKPSKRAVQQVKPWAQQWADPQWAGPWVDQHAKSRGG